MDLNASAQLFLVVLVVLFQSVLKSRSLVGGPSTLHTRKISMITAAEVSQHGGPQGELANRTSNTLVTCEELSEMAEGSVCV